MLGDKNEILVTSNRGVHRWEDKSKSWKFLDPKTNLKNPSLSTAALRNNELWIGYTNQSFGVLGQQGISVFDEEKLTWSYINPKQIGTRSPIRRISVMMNGDVWILFEKRPNRGAAAEFPFYPREADIFFQKSSIGRFRKGKWEYPLEFPELIDGTDFNQTVSDMVAIGDKLFISGRKGLYLGPNKWRRVIEGNIIRIEASDDGKSLIILRQGPRSNQNSSTFQRGRYDLATGKVSFEALPYEGLDIMQLDPPSYLWEYDDIGSEDSRLWAGEWVLLPNWKEGNWVIGPMGSNGYHGLIETPTAFWIASQGELVRLDRIRIEK
jgi:hypothetical protein